MSAFVVDKSTISAIIDGALKNGARYRSTFKWYHNNEWHELTLSNADAIGQMLLNENIKSVSYRYQDSQVTDLPGRTDASYIIPYKHPIFGKQYPVIQIIKLINCLDYQSCEHPEWDSSESKSFLDGLKNALICDLPGYEDSKWELVA